MVCTKSLFALSAALALTSAVPLAPSRRHRHHVRNQLNERELVTVYQTAYQTVYADGSTPTPTPQAVANNNAAVNNDVQTSNDDANNDQSDGSSSSSDSSSSSSSSSHHHHHHHSSGNSDSSDSGSSDSGSSDSDSSSSDSSNSGSSDSGSSAQVSGGKKGLAWDPASPNSMFSAVEKLGSWFYNWNAEAWGSTASASIPFYYTARTGEGLDILKSIPSGSTLFGFNEPDNAGQANMGVGQAVSLFKQYLTPLADKLDVLASPSVTNGPNGLSWLSSFMNQCSDCGINAINVHWYGANADDFISYMKQVHSQYPSMPIYVTEFACTRWDASNNPSESEVESFMRQTVSWLESTDYIAKYAWFGASDNLDSGVGKANQLVSDGNGDLTKLGQIYESL